MLFHPISDTASVTMALLLSLSVAGMCFAHPSRTRTNFSRSTFSNAQVEVKDNALTDTIHINVMSPGSHSQSDETAMSSPASPSPESPDSSKKGAKVSRPANAFILYRKHHHSDTVARNPGLHNNEICKSLSILSLKSH